MQHRHGQQHVTQGIDQRLESSPADADPLGQGETQNRDVGTGKALFLSLQRQLIAVFGDQHLGQQPRGGDALVDDLRRHLPLGGCLALVADPLAADVAFGMEHAQRVVQLLVDLLADPLQPPANAR